jgi:glycopeptide antibiotics resistance protein
VYDLVQNYGFQLVMITVIVIISLAAALVLQSRRPSMFGLDTAASALAIGSGLAILVGTVSRRGVAHGGQIQLVPFNTLLSYRNDTSDLLVYLGGNVALFMPLGFFLYLAMRHLALRFWLVITTMICAAVSVGVEILQLPIWTRSSDIDDVLTNATGGFLGALSAWILLWLIRAVKVSGNGPIRHYAAGSRAS